MVKLNMVGAIPTNHFPLAAFMLLDVNYNNCDSLLLSDFNSSSSVPFCYCKGVTLGVVFCFSLNRLTCRTSCCRIVISKENLSTLTKITVECELFRDRLLSYLSYNCFLFRVLLVSEDR